ncbi:hypothetical protein YQE_10827, partial [Dendroctonus ponderosae]
MSRLQVYLQRRHFVDPQSPQTNLQTVHRLSAAAGGERDDYLALFGPQVCAVEATLVKRTPITAALR